MALIGPSVGKLRIDMLHPLGEMFSKNLHVCSRIAETTHLFQKCRAEMFPIVSVAVLILKNCDADRSGAHGTRKVTITSQFVTINFYVCITF